MRKRWFRTKTLLPFLSLLITWIVLPTSTSAQIPGDWWPDPATNQGLSSWVAYSREYDALYRDLDQDPTHDQLVQQDIAAMLREGVQVAFVALSSATTMPHLQALSTRTDHLTMDVQSYLNRLDAQGIRACAAILSNNFTGDSAQLARFTLVDHLVEFNRSRSAGDAAFRCVATDLEMAACLPSDTVCPRSTAVYDLWKQFHLNMKNRITEGGSDLRLLAWIQGPDFLISRMADDADRVALMERENIVARVDDPALFTGAMRYFTTQGGVSIFDAIIPMWFFKPAGPYMRRVQHNFNELQSITGDRPFLIAGMMIRNEAAGLCCPDCVAGRVDYQSRLDFNDTFRGPSDPLFIGTGIFKWVIPEDWSCLASSPAARR